jgi:hypothetical protein
LVRRPLRVFDLWYVARTVHDDDECGVVDGMRIGKGNRVLGENLPNATLSITNPVWPDLRSNPGRHMDYGTALSFRIIRLWLENVAVVRDFTICTLDLILKHGMGGTRSTI